MTVAHGAVRGAVAITAECDPRGRTVLRELYGDGPLAPRRTQAHQPGAQVTLVGAMSAPLGGDRLRLTATVGPGAALGIGSAAATLALPGRAGGRAHYDIRLAVAEHAELRWAPEPLISVEGSDLEITTVVTLAPTARLVLREEQVLGRSGERSGRLSTRLAVHRAGRPLLDQELSFGSGAPGWDGGAVLGGHRAVGQLLVVDPGDGTGPPPDARPVGEGAVVMPLAGGPAVLATVVASDAIGMRRALEEAHRCATAPSSAGSSR